MRLWMMTLMTCIAATTACRNEVDSDLARRVKAELATDPDGAGVTVAVDDRVVRLTGVADSAAAKTRLENEIAHVDGVLAVRNELVVAPPVHTTGAVTDTDRAAAASIAAQLQAAGIRDVDVEVRGGTARLRGAVDRDKHDRALDIARRAAPALRVEDDTKPR